MNFPRAAALSIASALLSLAQPLAPMRPPAVPLVAHDPYFSIWSMADHLNDDATKHWTGKPNTLTAAIRVDGKVVAGDGPRKRHPPLPQTGVEVLPTRTIYTFAGAGIQLDADLSDAGAPRRSRRPLAARDLPRLEGSVDGRRLEHQVELYLDANADLTVNTADQQVSWGRFMLDGQPVLRMGSREQPILAKRGDDLRIDWGYLYLLADKNDGVTSAAVSHQTARALLSIPAANCRIPTISPNTSSLPARRKVPATVLAFSIDLGKVGAQPVSRSLMLAYDDQYSIEYFQRREQPWWRRNGAEVEAICCAAPARTTIRCSRAAGFDNELMADMRRVGGEKYARLAALAYRQTLAAHKLVAERRRHRHVLSEGKLQQRLHRDGRRHLSEFAVHACCSVPRCCKAQLQPVMEYAAMSRWKWPFAPHDLGTYPQANGQVYGGGELTEDQSDAGRRERQHADHGGGAREGRRQRRLREKYWPQLTKWAEYLLDKGLDPENQLSTDDFAGHLAHNANLSIKAILALGAYGNLADMTGHKLGSRALSQNGGGVRAEMGRAGGGRRPLSSGLRSGGHLEPEIQSGLGQTARPESVPRRRGEKGDRVLRDEGKQVRAAAG
jgi:hypothetical protein